MPIYLVFSLWYCSSMFCSSSALVRQVSFWSVQIFCELVLLFLEVERFMDIFDQCHPSWCWNRAAPSTDCRRSGIGFEILWIFYGWSNWVRPLYISRQHIPERCVGHLTFDHLGKTMLRTSLYIYLCIELINKYHYLFN